MFLSAGGSPCYEKPENEDYSVFMILSGKNEEENGLLSRAVPAPAYI